MASNGDISLNDICGRGGKGPSTIDGFMEVLKKVQSYDAVQAVFANQTFQTLIRTKYPDKKLSYIATNIFQFPLQYINLVNLI